MRMKLAAGNWKMNGVAASLAEVTALSDAIADTSVDTLICPPATLIAPMAALTQTRVMTGGQDCHANVSGAHTGDLSAQMLKDAGASHVIVGHSERRADHGETSADVKAKAEAALAAGLCPIICVGETLDERESGETLDVIRAQLAGSIPDSAAIVIAYEPVWAIGTGKVPTLAEIGEVHDDMFAQLTLKFGEQAAQIGLLYGGSVKPSNAAEIFAISNVDGALVGGASLKAVDFAQIVQALDAA